MYKFAGFEHFLERNEKNVLQLTFSEIEKMIGQPLCYSAYHYSAYWHPSKTHNFANIIVENGYIIEELDLEKQYVRLKKNS